MHALWWSNFASASWNYRLKASWPTEENNRLFLIVHYYFYLVSFAFTYQTRHVLTRSVVERYIHTTAHPGGQHCTSASLAPSVLGQAASSFDDETALGSDKSHEQICHFCDRPRKPRPLSLSISLDVVWRDAVVRGPEGHTPLPLRARTNVSCSHNFLFWLTTTR